MPSPLITVLMPVYNGGQYLSEAIDSILNQTFCDFEFLIIDDGSTDNSVNIIKTYSDPRIRLIYNKRNQGVVKSLNKGIMLSKGKFIARMDSDDISLPGRFSQQLNYFKANQDVGICGTWIKTIGDIKGNIWRYPTTPNDIQCWLLFHSVLAHPSVMMCREILERNHLLYDSSFIHAEDFQLWQRASQVTKLGNLDKVLLLYRISKYSVSRCNKAVQNISHQKIDNEALNRLGIQPSPSELCLHRRLGFYDFESTKEYVCATGEWLHKLILNNKKTQCYPETVFEKIIAGYWYKVCAHATKLGMWTWISFWKLPLHKTSSLHIKEQCSLFLKCVTKNG